MEMLEVTVVKWGTLAVAMGIMGMKVNSFGISVQLRKRNCKCSVNNSVSMQIRSKWWRSLPLRRIARTQTSKVKTTKRTISLNILAKFTTEARVSMLEVA